MRSSEFFIRRATTTTLLITAIAGFGLLSYLSLPVSNLPEVEYPTIYVSAELPGLIQMQWPQQWRPLSKVSFPVYLVSKG
jgi:multidrug efflux pump subunit AcrB